MISRTSEPDSLKTVLQMSLGCAGHREKDSELSTWSGRRRIHLDEVEGLGSFVELEVVMQTKPIPCGGVQIARGLMAQT